jgi:hypothetical protein
MPSGQSYLYRVRFDTACNLANKGGSLGIGTRITEGNFVNSYGTSPSATDESQLEMIFSMVYQQYNSSLGGYGDSVIANSQSYEPSPTGAIFSPGGQQ